MLLLWDCDGASMLVHAIPLLLWWWYGDDGACAAIVACVRFDVFHDASIRLACRIPWVYALPFWYMRNCFHGASMEAPMGITWWCFHRASTSIGFPCCSHVFMRVHGDVYASIAPMAF